MSWLLSTEKQTNKNETKRTAVPELFHTGNVPDGIFFIPDIAVLCGFVSTVSAPSTHTQQETGTQTPAFPSFLSYTTDTALFSPVSFQRRTSCALPPVPPDSCSFCVGRRPPYSTQWILDSIPYETALGITCGEIEVNFLAELHQGDRVRIEQGETSEGTTFVIRRMEDDRPAFLSRYCPL